MKFRLTTLLALGILAGSALPAQAAEGLAPLGRGLIAPADITGGILFGKNGEVIPLDAKGKPQSPCVMSKAVEGKAKAGKLPECPSGPEAGQGEQSAPKSKGGVPCQGYYIIVINNRPVVVWYPSGCTPP
ncbi:hypothetical protein [Zoogloea sp.]|uniref:hypothetical protein n=1 Tax=Zoogloea sp. TaxID=49181 RepID=UPI0025EAFE1E|nr:hypothetical protein [Zoogloea sp.]MCK6394876.1 hypothetical protein [Zoogloea sp.]